MGKLKYLGAFLTPLLAYIALNKFIILHNETCIYWNICTVSTSSSC